MNQKCPAYSLMILIVVIHIIPFYIVVNLAFKTRQDTSSMWTPPTYLYSDNFQNSWEKATLDRSLRNNITITGTAVFLVVVS